MLIFIYDRPYSGKVMCVKMIVYNNEVAQLIENVSLITRLLNNLSGNALSCMERRYSILRFMTKTRYYGRDREFHILVLYRPNLC